MSKDRKTLDGHGGLWQEPVVRFSSLKQASVPAITRIGTAEESPRLHKVESDPE